MPASSTMLKLSVRRQPKSDQSYFAGTTLDGTMFIDRPGEAACHAFGAALLAADVEQRMPVEAAADAA